MIKLHNLKLQGVITAQTPIIHIRETSKKADGTPISYAIKEHVPYTDEDGNMGIKEVPYIQGSSVRGRTRDCMAEAVASSVKGLLSCDVAQRLWNGGALEKGKDLSLEQRRMILERCPDLGLFGGIAGNMFPSKIRFSPLYPIVDTTIKAGLVPLYYEKHKTPETVAIKNDKGEVIRTLDALRATCVLTRRDEMLEGAEKLVQYLSDQGLEDAEDYIRRGMEAQAAKAEERNSGKEGGSKKVIAKHYSMVEVIPAGTKLFAEIHVNDANMVEIGLALKTLQNFFKQPYIGGRSAAGYGKVSFEMAALWDDGDWEDYPDFITYTDRGESVLNYPTLNWVKQAMSAYDEWAKNSNAETLDVKDVIKA